MNILITGANGFVGQALSQSAINLGYQVNCAVRNLNGYITDTDTNSASAHSADLKNAKVFEVGNIDANTNWQLALDGVDVVVHLAARVHVMRENTQDPLAEFRKVNVAGTLNLANQAVNAGVKRFIYLSSIKVNGELTQTNAALTSRDTPNPQDAYGVSKFEAEQGLKHIAEAAGLAVVIIRPPLIYGKGVKANFANMLKLVKLGLPLPFGAIRNKRSLIYVENLVGFIVSCMHHPNATNQTFLVCDGEDVSTTALLRACAKAMQKKIWLLPVPQSWLTCALNCLGKKALVQRLFGNLQIDNRFACEALNWQPPFTLAQGLKKTVSGNRTTEKVEGLMLKRLFDLTLALVSINLLMLPFILVWLMVRITSPGNTLYWSDRVGQHNRLFKMPKFRSMRTDTPAVATHLLNNPAQYLTPIGNFLRKSSLDELPQLWSIIKGDMSFVGPRPALFNQDDLIALRKHHGVDALLPGLTGWAQINGRDELPIAQKVELDVYYLRHQSLWLDIQIIARTFVKVLRKEGIQH